jgi:hypothetical protein
VAAGAEDAAEATTSEEAAIAPPEPPSPAAGEGDGPSAAEHPVASDPSEAETTLYDQSLDDELDLDEAAPGVEDEASAEAGGEAAAEPPIERLETVEHPLDPESQERETPSDEPAAGEAGLAEPASGDVALELGSEDLELEEPPAEELAPSDAGDEHEAQSGSSPKPGSREDVLADTPEFLRDAPENDELWFEQGEPKDFDFG